MTDDMLLVVALLVVTIALFISDRLRMDVVAIILIIALMLTGLLSPAEALAGFGDPLVILIAALFVVGEGLFRCLGAQFRLRPRARLTSTPIIDHLAIRHPERRHAHANSSRDRPSSHTSAECDWKCPWGTASRGSASCHIRIGQSQRFRNGFLATTPTNYLTGGIPGA